MPQMPCVACSSSASCTRRNPFLHLDLPALQLLSAEGPGTRGGPCTGRIWKKWHAAAGTAGHGGCGPWGPKASSPGPAHQQVTASSRRPHTRCSFHLSPESWEGATLLLLSLLCLRPPPPSTIPGLSDTQMLRKTCPWGRIVPYQLPNPLLTLRNPVNQVRVAAAAAWLRLSSPF